MRTAETVSSLARLERRGAGTDAERRAARRLADELTQSGRDVRIEPFWCRPNWAMAHSWHAGLGIVGSLVSVSTPGVGGALILVALGSVLADALLGGSPGRRLTPERASQNVVASPPGAETARRVRLIITANYDAGRIGLAYRDRIRAAIARLRELTHGATPGWLGWIAIALAWLLALALLLEIASADFGPAAGDNGAGVSVAIALARALDAAPPRHAAVEVVLAGAGDQSGIGLRKYLRARRRALEPGNVVVLGIAPCTAGAPRWWVSDGALVPLRSSAALRELCATVAMDEPYLQARPHRGRGSSPALPATVARLPAITIGCLDGHGIVPRSHQRSDTADAVDAAALDRAVELGLLLVDAIDGLLSRAGRPAPGDGIDARPA